MSFHDNKLTAPVVWREEWQSVDGRVKRVQREDDEVEWTEYLANVEREEAANVAARTRTAKPAMLPAKAQLLTEETSALPTTLVARSHMDKEKLRGMLEDWDELTTTCDDAVTAVYDRYTLNV